MARRVEVERDLFGAELFGDVGEGRGRDGEVARRGDLGRNRGLRLEVEIGRGDRQPVGRRAQQHVGQDRNGGALLRHARDGVERPGEVFSGDGEFHRGARRLGVGGREYPSREGRLSTPYARP
jgi:hypothetical protein